jgi:hypothetical protein
MLCDFCMTDVRDDFLGKERVDNNEVVFLCAECKEKLKQINVIYEDE